MRLHRVIWAATLIAPLSTFTLAQSTIEVVASGQPLTYTKSGRVEGCGIRIVGVIEPLPGQSTFKSFDVSANVWASGTAIAKFIGEETSVTAARDPSAGKRLRLHDGWLKVDGGEPVSTPRGTFKESPTDKGAYLYTVDVETAFKFIVATSRGERFQAGLRWQPDVEWVYFGALDMPLAQRQQLAQCIREMLK